MNGKRGGWYLLGGLFTGIGIGVLTAWVIAPVQFTDTSPASLRTDFKDEYRLLIASAYDANPDLVRARARLDTLADADASMALLEQLSRMGNTAQAQNLGRLKDALAALPAPTSVITPSPSPTSATDTPTPTEAATSAQPLSPTETEAPPLPTASARPTGTPFTAIHATRTPSPTPGKPYELVKQSTFCDEEHPALLKVNLKQSNGKPSAGVEITITWVDGTENFFTGLKPELGAGYADFVMTRDVAYALNISNNGTLLTGLSAPDCGSYPGGILLELSQP